MRPPRRSKSINRNQRIKHARLLIYRLEHLSADSPWAHRAGGLKVALLRGLDTLEGGDCAPALEHLLQEAYALLTAAAREIPEAQPWPETPDTHPKP